MDPRIQKLAATLGIKLDVTRAPNDPRRAMWDGKSLGCKGMSNQHLLHDIAHWILASAERRRLPDYGLGTGPDTSLSCQTKPIMSWEEADREEGLTCALELAFLRAYGMDWSHGTKTYSMSEEEILFSWDELRMKGLLDENFCPKVVS